MRSGPSSEFAPAVFFSLFFVMMVKPSCDVPNPLIRHFPQSGGSGRWRLRGLRGWAAGFSHRMRWPDSRAGDVEERVGTSRAAFARSVCESV